MSKERPEASLLAIAFLFQNVPNGSHLIVIKVVKLNVLYEFHVERPHQTIW